LHDIQRLDLNLLRVFDVLMRERSVSLAAAQLHVTQPAVSNALNRLREVCDDKLFVRTRAGMEPTPAAVALHNPIREALRLVQAALAEGLSFDPASSERCFTILTTDVGEAIFCPRLYRKLSVEAPRMTLRIMEAAHEEYEKLLESGGADFAFGYFHVSDSFCREYFASSKYVALLCSGYAGRLGISSGDVIPYEVYVRADHLDVTPRVVAEGPFAAALRHIAPFRRVALRVPHISGLSALIPETEQVAAVPQAAAVSLCANDKLSWALLPFEAPTTTLHIGWHKRHEGDRGHVWMRSLLRSIRMEYATYPEEQLNTGEALAAS
jgi:DNA-binding transcriptional LysR family regulator